MPGSSINFGTGALVSCLSGQGPTGSPGPSSSIWDRLKLVRCTWSSHRTHKLRFVSGDSARLLTGTALYDVGNLSTAHATGMSPRAGLPTRTPPN